MGRADPGSPTLLHPPMDGFACPMPPLPRPSRWGRKLFLGFLGSVASYAAIVTYHLRPPLGWASPRWMEKCRELCLSYGLIPTGNIAMDAGAYLAVAKPQDLRPSKTRRPRIVRRNGISSPSAVLRFHTPNSARTVSLYHRIGKRIMLEPCCVWAILLAIGGWF